MLRRDVATKGMGKIETSEEWIEVQGFNSTTMVDYVIRGAWIVEGHQPHTGLPVAVDDPPQEAILGMEVCKAFFEMPGQPPAEMKLFDKYLPTNQGEDPLIALEDIWAATEERSQSPLHPCSFPPIHLQLKEGHQLKGIKQPFKPKDAEYDLYRKEIGSMVEKGFLVPSFSHLAFPIVTQRKKNRKLRLCFGGAELSKWLVKDRYPQTRVNVCIQKIAQRRFYTIVDLSSGYMQYQLDRKSQELYTVVTLFGKYSFTRLPFGLSTSGTCF